MKCLVCGSEPVRHVAKRDQFERFLAYAPFVDDLARYNRSIIKCDACGLAFIDPPYAPDEIDGLYKNYNVFSVADKSVSFSEKDVSIWLEQFRNIGLHQWRTDFEQAHGRPPKVLDIGCGYGRILHLFNLMGCEVHGIDLNSDGIRHIKEAYGFDVESCDFLDFNPDTKFDLIALFHVIEHVCDPHKAIDKIASLLSDDGLLLIETPWAEDVGIYEERYCDIYHTLFFNHLSLHLLGACHNFLARSSQNISFRNDNLGIDRAQKPFAFHKYLQVLFARSDASHDLSATHVKALGAMFNRLEAECSAAISRSWNLEHQNGSYKRLLDDPAMRKKVFSDILRKDFNCTRADVERLVTIVFEIGSAFLGQSPQGRPDASK